MLEATKGVDAGAGVLHIVKNYTGDVMNFEMAAELAAANTGITVDASSSMMMSPSRTRSTPQDGAESVSRCCSKSWSVQPPRKGALSELGALARDVNESVARWAWL